MKYWKIIFPFGDFFIVEATSTEGFFIPFPHDIKEITKEEYDEISHRVPVEEDQPNAD